MPRHARRIVSTGLGEGLLQQMPRHEWRADDDDGVRARWEIASEGQLSNAPPANSLDLTPLACAVQESGSRRVVRARSVGTAECGVPGVSWLRILRSNYR